MWVESGCIIVMLLTSDPLSEAAVSCCWSSKLGRDGLLGSTFDDLLDAPETVRKTALAATIDARSDTSLSLNTGPGTDMGVMVSVGGAGREKEVPRRSAGLEGRLDDPPSWRFEFETKYEFPGVSETICTPGTPCEYVIVVFAEESG